MNYSRPNLWPRTYAAIPAQSGNGGAGSFVVITQDEALLLATQLDTLTVSPAGTMETGTWTTGKNITLDIGATVQINTLAGGYGASDGSARSRKDFKYSTNIGGAPPGLPLINPQPWPDPASRVLSDGDNFTLGNWNAPWDDPDRRDSYFSLGIGLSAGVWRLCYAFSFRVTGPGTDSIVMTDPSFAYVPSYSGTWTVFGHVLQWKAAVTTFPTNGPLLGAGITTTHTMY